MNFTTFCDNKGCHKEMSPVVDKDTLVAYCTDCGDEISCVTEFMRRQLVANGNIRKLNKKKMAWSVICPGCKKEGTPDVKDNKLFCQFCEKEQDHLSPPYAHTLKMNLKSRKI